jgi:hypothetical protein
MVLRVLIVKADRGTSSKVLKLRELEIEPGGSPRRQASRHAPLRPELSRSSNRLPTGQGDGTSFPFAGRRRRMAIMLKAHRAPLIVGGSLAFSLVLATAGVALGAPNPRQAAWASRPRSSPKTASAMTSRTPSTRELGSRRWPRSAASHGSRSMISRRASWTDRADRPGGHGPSRRDRVAVAGWTPRSVASRSAHRA